MRKEGSRSTDLSGTKYGRLVADKLSVRGGRTYWWCTCECGTRKLVRSDSLRSGAVVSCGCYHRERAAEFCRVRRTTHGASSSGPGGGKTPEYGAWSNALYRCRDRTNKYFPDYGARGISVCSRWDSFENFLVDMGERPSPAHSLDRINNHGNYEPGNCRWATQDIQHANRRRLRDYVAELTAKDAYIAELEAELAALQQAVVD